MKKLCKSHHKEYARSLCKTHKDKTMCNLHKAEYEKHMALHKSEEGAHNGAEDKEGKEMFDADNENNRHDDCQYCQHLDAQENADGTAGMHDDCPMCAEMDGKSADDHSDCPYCQEMEQKEGDGCPYCEDMSLSQANPQPEDHICNCPNCPEHTGTQDSLPADKQGIAAEDVYPEDHSPENCPECQKMFQDAIENEPGQVGQEPPQTQGHETAEEVLNMLDQEAGQGEPPEEEAKKIDNTELPQGDAMEDGTSVKENFGDAQKDDISDAEKNFGQDHQCDCPNCPGSKPVEDAGQDPTQSASDPMQSAGQDPTQDTSEMEDDQPDMADVLRGGLDEHASEQKKQQVLDMVGNTLQGFKANKASLEAAKEQNMPLYQSTIQMLKAMISLCDLLGLKPKPMATASPTDAGAAPAQDGAPTSKAPPAAAPQGGAAESPKT